MVEKRILIVDDVEFNIEFEQKMIESLMTELSINIEVDTAATVEEAITKISANNVYDAMIIDMNLPDGSGVEIAKASHKKSESTRIAALTIYPSKYEEYRAFFDLFMRKPIMPNEYKQNFVRLLQL